MSNKRTFTVDKIRTDEICGITGGDVTICGIDSVNLDNISAQTITGNNLIISGSGSSSINLKSGVFETVTIGGVEYVPRGQIAYGFRFGGPPINVPERLPYITGTTDYTGLKSGTNLVFVEDSSSFESGDHILVGGLTDENEKQENHVVTGFSHYYSSDCCNVIVDADRNSGTTRVSYRTGIPGHVVKTDDYVTLTGTSQTYRVTDSYHSGPGTKYFDVAPALWHDVLSGDSVCITPPTLHTESNLSNNFVTGTIVANKFAQMTTNDLYDFGTEGDPHWNNVALLIRSGTADSVILDYSNSAHQIDVHSGAFGTTAEKHLFDSSIQFDGVDDHLSVTGTVSDFYDKDFTVDFWFKKSEAGSVTDSMTLCGSTQLTIQGSLRIQIGDGTWKNSRGATVDDTNKIVAFFPYGYDGNTANQHTKSFYNLIIGDTEITDTNWHHVAATRNGKYLYLFVDGIREGTAFNSVENANVIPNDHSTLPSPQTSLNTVGNTPHPFRIGLYKVSTYGNTIYGGRGAFKGNIEDFRVTKNIARYTQDFTLPTGVAGTSFKADQCASKCYDTRYLYVDKAMYANKTFDWHLTGYRESFIGFSGIKFNVTGDNTSGLFTMVYPNI